jgi:hypothetical protein
VLVAAALAWSGNAVSASVYRWIDKNGEVHYDDTSSGGRKLTREFLDERVVPDEPEWVGVIPSDFVAEVQQRCSNAKERLASYGSAPVIYGRDPSGNTYTLSPTQARLMIAEIQGESDRYCAPDAPRRIYTERIAAVKAERARKQQAPPGR